MTAAKKDILVTHSLCKIDQDQINIQWSYGNVHFFIRIYFLWSFTKFPVTATGFYGRGNRDLTRRSWVQIPLRSKEFFFLFGGLQFPFSSLFPNTLVTEGFFVILQPKKRSANRKCAGTFVFFFRSEACTFFHKICFLSGREASPIYNFRRLVWILFPESISRRNERFLKRKLFIRKYYPVPTPPPTV